ncbi:uncharacterized protein LOC120341931 isoform X1 [Styela clava]
MAIPNGRVPMENARSPTTLSPNRYSPAKGIPQSATSSTLRDTSLDELDRIMDTLSTLSRGASLAGGGNGPKGFNGPSPLSSDQMSYPTTGTGSESTTPFSATSPVQGFPVTSPMTLPPPMTSPPQTPVAPSPRHYSSNPKIMTMSAMPSHQFQGFEGLNEARNPATVPRLPSNPYENTSILHGSHMMRPSNHSTSDFASFPQSSIPDSYINSNYNTENNGQFFFGPLPVSPQQNNHGRYPPTGPKPASMIPHSSSDPDYSQNKNRNNREDYAPVNSNAQSGSRPKQNRRQNQESMTLPVYNEKRSYLKNLEQGTLPRPRIESARIESSRPTTPQLSRKLHKPKPSLGEEAANSLNRLSMRRHSSKGLRRPAGKFGLRNLSKTSSRHSTTSFNSFDLGRGYASVSTAPASTHGLIHHEILPNGRSKGDVLFPLPVESTNSGTDVEDQNCCMKCGTFLYSHMLELFVIVAFLAGIPIGIILQATKFHTTSAFAKYYSFWGSTMLPAVLSTITPMIIISSMLTGMSNLTPSILRKLTALSAIFYIISTLVAVLIGLGFSILIKPGQIAMPRTNSTNNNSLIGDINWTDPKVLLQNEFFKDARYSVYAFSEDTLFYNTSQVKNITAADEILSLIRLLFPGCGIPNKEDTTSGLCNVFVLAIFAGAIGYGASIMRAEGGPIRHVISQVGTVMSNMADIMLWYIPIGIVIYVSEMSATRINWENVGNTQQTTEIADFGGNTTANLGDVTEINIATMWYLLAVLASLGLYCLVLMPLAVSLITLSNPFALLGFRSIAPLLAATTIGFSDLCIPITVRCLLKRKGTTRCCMPQEKIDSRISRISGVMGGIFHRGGSAIVIVCSTMFLCQLGYEEIGAFGMVVMCFSATITSVTSLGGRWFYGGDPTIRAIVIGMTTAGVTSPSVIPRTILTMWLISRLAAFTDTIIDFFGAHLLQRACTSELEKISTVRVESSDSGSSDSSNLDNKVAEITSSVNKSPPVRTNSGEISDYEDAPLLFSRTEREGNESSSVNSHNDDSVFLPSKSHTSRNHLQADTGVTSHTRNLQQRQIALANHGLHSSSAANQNIANTARDLGPRQSEGVSNPAINNKDEISFVTF